MDQAILKVISTLAPSVGNVISEYFGKKKDISAEEIQVLLLSKVLENNSQILRNQDSMLQGQLKLTDLEDKVTEMLRNHIEHEMQAILQISEIQKKTCSTLADTRESLRDLKIDLIKAKIIK